MENLKSKVEKKNCKENSITKKKKKKLQKKFKNQKKKKNIFDGYNYYCSSCMSVSC